MFEPTNIDQGYTFTQTGARSFKTQSEKLISHYVENFGLLKNKNTENLIEDETSDEAVDKVKQDKNKEELNETEDLTESFSDEDESGIGIVYGTAYSVSSSFDTLAAAVGASNDKVSKGQLIALLSSLSSGPDSSDNAKEIAFVKNLIAKFDSLSDGTEYITSFNGVNEIQDYETVTQEQVTPPIDLRV